MLGLGNALKKVKSLVPKVVNAGKKAVKTAAKKVAHSALGRAVASIPSAVRAGAVKVGQITRKAVAAIPKIIEPIKRKAVEKVDQIKNSVTGKVAQIKKTVNTAVGQAKITVDQMQNAVDQKVSEFITVTEPKNKRIVEKLKAELANTYSDLMRGVTTQGASPEYILLTTSPILLEFFLKYRRAVIEEYPMLELPVPVLRGPLNFIRNQITNKGAAAGSFIYKQNIPGLSDFVGELTDQRGPGAESNAFSVVGAGVRGVVVKGLLGTVDGIATLIEDPVTALEGINSIVAHPDESIPAICDGVKTFWDDKVVNGSPEDRAEVVGQAVFEVATWLIGVGEVKTGTTVGKTAKMVQGAEKIDDISQVGKISKTLKLTKKAELVKDSLRIAKSTVIEKTASKINKAWLKNLGKATAKSFDDAIMKAGKKTGNIIDDIGMGMNKGPKLAFETVGDFDSLSNTGDLITDYLSNVKKMVKNKLDSTGNHKVNIKPKVEADDLSKSIKKSGDGPGAIAEGTGGSNTRLIPGTEGVVTGGDSTKLGKNMMESMGQKRSTKWTGYQAQHIIPSEMADHQVLQKIGMNLDDATNGLFLRTPADDISAMSRHRGYHSTYNEFVKTQLDAIDITQDVNTLQRQVLDLQSNLKKLQQSGLPLYPNQGASIDLWQRSLGRIQ